MAEQPAPLSILDLSPVSEGSTSAVALRNTIDLARRAEEAGYHRYWVGEHHFVPGVVSSAPAVLIGAIAAATPRIRVGSGAVQLGHQTAAAAVEAFGTRTGSGPSRCSPASGATTDGTPRLVAGAAKRGVDYILSI
jgi:Luciferase-like monooxygenase